jgi:hypothetical protein
MGDDVDVGGDPDLVPAVTERVDRRHETVVAERVPGGRTGPVAAEVDHGAARQRRDRRKEYDERTEAAVQVRPAGRRAVS